MTKEHALLAIYPAFPSGLKVKDARSDVRILALADFAFAVEIPNRLRQDPKHIGPFSSQGIVDMVRRGDVRLSTLESPRHAKQAHQVGVVCMKELAVEMSVEDNATRAPSGDRGHTVHLSDKF